MSSLRIAALLLGLVTLAPIRDGAMPGQSGQVPHLSPGEAVMIAGTYHLWQSVGESVWPGWTEIPMPLLYVTKDYEYAIGFPERTRGFETLPGVKLAGRTMQVRKRVLDTDPSASFDVEGVAAAVLGQPEALKKSSALWVLTAAHEMFHVFQAARGSHSKVAALKIGPEKDASWQLSFPFPYQNPDVMRLIHLQGYLLYLAANAKDEADAKYNVGTALEAAQVYQNHLQSLAADGKSYRYSQSQEWDEGVAFYVEYKMSEASAMEAYQPTREFAALPDYKDYRRLWRDDYSQRPFLAKHAGRAARSRTAFYHLGFAKAMALDRLRVDWKARYFSQNVWLDDLLGGALTNFK